MTSAGRARNSLTDPRQQALVDGQSACDTSDEPMCVRPRGLRTVLSTARLPDLIAAVVSPLTVPRSAARTAPLAAEGHSGGTGPGGRRGVSRRGFGQLGRHRDPAGAPAGRVSDSAHGLHARRSRSLIARQEARPRPSTTSAPGSLTSNSPGTRSFDARMPEPITTSGVVITSACTRSGQ